MTTEVPDTLQMTFTSALSRCHDELYRIFSTNASSGFAPDPTALIGLTVFFGYRVLTEKAGSQAMSAAKAGSLLQKEIQQLSLGADPGGNKNVGNLAQRRFDDLVTLWEAAQDKPDGLMTFYVHALTSLQGSSDGLMDNLNTLTANEARILEQLAEAASALKPSVSVPKDASGTEKSSDRILTYPGKSSSHGEKAQSLGGFKTAAACLAVVVLAGAGLGFWLQRGNDTTFSPRLSLTDPMLTRPVTYVSSHGNVEIRNISKEHRDGPGLFDEAFACDSPREPDCKQRARIFHERRMNQYRQQELLNKTTYGQNLSEAQNGNPESQFALHEILTSRLGIKPDHEAALSWLVAAARQGHAAAQFDLGVKFAEGNDVEKDPQRAIALMESAAGHLDADRQSTLAQKLVAGDGVILNKEKALFWARKAANVGDGFGQTIAANILYERGGRNDLIEAYKWANLLAAQNRRFNEKLRSKIAERMSKSDIAEAQRASAEWKPNTVN